MKKLAGLGDPVAQDIPVRERRVCLAYGLVATVCSFSVLGLAILKIGSFFIEQSQPLAFMIFSGLLGNKIRRRFKKFFGKASDVSDDDDEDFDTPLPPQSAESRMPEPAEAGTVEPADSKPSQPVESRRPELAES